jgi:hypothetical protein
MPEVEKTLAKHMADSVVGKVGLGFENWGDHSSSGYVQGTYLWDNNEYDLPAAAFVHFARTGDEGALRIALASAQHYVDVDCIHHSSKRPEDVGAPHTHSHGDVGHHTADRPGMHHAGYTFGLLLATYFTGDPDGLEGARSIADWVLRSISPENTVGQMERAMGHPLMTLTDLYEATWEDRYLQGAARLVDWATKWEHPVHSGFLAPITEQPAYYSGSTFCGGLLPSGLLKFNGWARLPEIDAMLERVARWTLTEMWRPPAGIMSKGGSPRRKAEPDNIATHLRLMREMYLRTRDPLFLAVPRESIAAGFGPGKTFGTRATGLVFNYVPWYLSMLSELGDPRPAHPAPKPENESVQIQRGAAARICFDLRAEASEMRTSFQPRLDFVVRPLPVDSGRWCYEVTAPSAINLTSEYNRISWAQWTASYLSDGKPQVAHAWVRIELK